MLLLFSFVYFKFRASVEKVLANMNLFVQPGAVASFHHEKLSRKILELHFSAIIGKQN